MSIDYQALLNKSGDYYAGLFGGWNTNELQFTFLKSGLIPEYYYDILPSYYYSPVSPIVIPSFFLWNSTVLTGPTIDGSDFSEFRDRQKEAINFILLDAELIDQGNVLSLYKDYRVSFADVADIQFSEKVQTVEDVNDVGQITFYNADLFRNDLGYAALSNTQFSSAGDVFISRDNLSNQDISIAYGQIGFWTLLTRPL